MSRLERWWEQVWFAPASPVGLIAARWLVFTTVIADLSLNRRRYHTLPDRAEVLWEPISVLAVLQLPPPNGLVISMLLAVTVAAAAATLLRLVPHASGAVAAAGYTMLVVASNSLGKVDHDRHVVVVAVIVLAVAAAPRLHDAPSWRYRWPVQLSRASIAVMLTGAAWSKLTTSGLDWVFSENLRIILTAETLLFRDPPLGELSLWIAAHPLRWQLAAAGVLASQLLSIGAVVAPGVWRRLFALGAGGAIVGITLLMGLVGFPIVGLVLLLVDLEPMVRQVQTATVRAVTVAAPVAAWAAVTVCTYLFVQPKLPPTQQLMAVAPAVVAAAVVAWQLVRLAGCRQLTPATAAPGGTRVGAGRTGAISRRA
jgi:hypothetical protein